MMNKSIPKPTGIAEGVPPHGLSNAEWELVCRWRSLAKRSVPAVLVVVRNPSGFISIYEAGPAGTARGLIR